MARALTGRLHATGTLTTRTALHVGGAASDGVAADLVPARDGAERLMVPGTSLAGALRTASFEAAAAEPGLEEAWKATWGAPRFALLESASERDTADAGLIWVWDAVCQGGSTGVRDHVAIDRALGASAHRMKHDRLVVDPGARFELRLALELPADEDHEPLRSLLAAMLAELERGAVTLGAATTRGLGRVALGELSVREESLGTRAGVLAALAARQTAAAQAGGEPPRLEHLERWKPPTSASAQPVPRRASILISWRPERSLVVRAGQPSEAADSVPLTTAVGDGKLAFVLPGSSAKGALRTAAERIVRTLGKAPPATVVTPKHPHHDQIAVPLVSVLFGAPKRRDAAGGRGALSIADCHSKLRFPEEDWRAALQSDDPLAAERAVQEIPGLEKVVIVHHNSLDRWTGAAADQRLFSVLEPRAVDWEPLELTVDTARLERAGVAPALAGALLWLVLTQFTKGEIPLGGMTTRGHGALGVEEINVRGVPLGLQNGAFAGDPPPLTQAARDAWEAWLGLDPSVPTTQEAA